MKEFIYYNSPIIIQNILISFYGYKIDKIRHGKQYKKILDIINKRLYFSSAELKEFQNKSLCELISLCAQNVPYYKKIFKKERLTESDIKTIDDLTKIPFLEKAQLRKNPTIFINENYKKNNLLKIHTTGTTGTPLTIYCNSFIRQKNYAFYNRFLNHAGINYRKSRATFGGRLTVPISQHKPPFWRHSYFQKNLLFSSYHLREKTIESYINKLLQYRPHYIDSYPSSIYAIANYAKKHKINLQGITQGITTSAETLFNDQRIIIEEVFGVPIIDQYGTAEMCVFIGQCAQGRYHVHTDYAIVEFLRKDGSQAKAGEEAEVICTGLLNPIMPLIRYKIGDMVIVSDEKCTCGCAFPVIEKVIGRIDDVILTPEGNKVGRLSPILKGFPIKEAQYLQNNVHTVTLRLVPNDDYSAATEKKLVLELRKRLGHKIEIHIEQVKYINRGVGAKMKTVISTLT